MYGNEIGLPAAGAIGVTTGVVIGSQILAIAAILLIIGGLIFLVVNHHRRKGLRP